VWSILKLSKEAIEELKEIYRKEFGKEISDEEAQEMGIRLIRFFKIILRPIPREMDNKQFD
jgi:hypothetical protein